MKKEKQMFKKLIANEGVKYINQFKTLANGDLYSKTSPAHRSIKSFAPLKANHHPCIHRSKY
jgi:hypothetical protein